MDYGRMDMVNGNYMEENNRRMAEEEQRRKAEEERRRAEELRMEEQRLEEERRTAVMRGNFPFFGWASAVYALFYTFCLYKNASGITYPFFVAGTLIYFGLCTRRSGVPLKKDSTFTVVSMLLLGVSVFLTDNLSIQLITKTGLFLLTISLMLHQYLDDSKWNFSKFLLAIGQCLLETVACLGRPFSDGAAWRVKAVQEGKKDGKGRYVALGILVAVPLTLLILALLVSADAVFRDLFVRVFRHINILSILCILCMLAFGFLGSYCFIAMLNSRVIKEECKENRNQEPVLAITFTSVLAALYLVFSMIQIVYLFMGQMKLPEGYTYSSYARQGFFQLLAVCLINLAIVLVCLGLFQGEQGAEGHSHRNFPLYLYYGGFQCISYDSVYQDLPAYLSEDYCAVGAGGDGFCAGGDYRYYFPPGFPVVSVLYDGGDGFLSGACLCKAGLLDCRI